MESTQLAIARASEHEDGASVALPISISATLIVVVMVAALLLYVYVKQRNQRAEKESAIARASMYLQKEAAVQQAVVRIEQERQEMAAKLPIGTETACPQALACRVEPEMQRARHICSHPNFPLFEPSMTGS